MTKVKCISKNRNTKGIIINYNLQDETGRQFQATADQIKAEIKAGRYDFINLQIDKAGRLVDKAIEKPINNQKPAETEDEKIYTVQDLINYVNPKGYTVKVYHKDLNKEITTRGVDFWNTKGSEGIHNTIYVYSSETHKKYVAGIENNRICVNDNSSYLVDFLADPNGQYTLVAYGKALPIEDDIRDAQRYNEKKPEFIRMYRVRDNQSNTEFWLRYLNINKKQDTGKTDFTNISIIMDKEIYPKNLKVTDLTDTSKKYNTLEENTEKLLHKILDDGHGIEVDGEAFSITGIGKDNSYFKAIAKLEAYAKKYNLMDFKYYSSYNDMFLDKINDLEDEDNVIWVGFDDCNEVYYTKSLKAAKKWLYGEILTLREAGWSDDNIKGALVIKGREKSIIDGLLKIKDINEITD